MMKSYTEKELWASSLKNQFQLEGYQESPIPSTDMIPIPPNTTRKQEVQFISLLYKNNLLNHTLWNMSKVPSPLCSNCNQEEETADHLLFNCLNIEEQLRVDAKARYRRALKLNDEDMEPETFIGLLNASKDSNFVNICIDIVKNLDIRVTFEL